MLNNRGLTIAEILIALAINAIIVLAVVTLVSNTMLSGKTSENRQELATDFGLLQNFFARTIPNAGGMSIPTDAAFYLDDSCAGTSKFPNCDGSDRLTIASSDEGPACTIQTFVPATGVATLNTVVDGGGSTVCCMTVRPLIHNHVFFVNGYDYRQMWVTTADDVSCSATFSPGPIAANDNVDNTYGWAGGVVIPVHLDSFYFNPADNTFNRYVYSDAGPGVDDGVNEVLADRVLDFQVALGYDFNLADGAIVDDGSATDEWLFNASGDSRSAVPFASTPGLPRNSLRMIAIGWVIGAPGGGPSSGMTTASVLNGPPRTKAGWILQSGVAKLGARSVYVFD